jgi:hypothetical protein
MAVPGIQAIGHIFILTLYLVLAPYLEDGSQEAGNQLLD